MGNFAPIGLPPGGAFFTPDGEATVITLPNGMQIPVGALAPAAQALIADAQGARDPRMTGMEAAREQVGAAKKPDGYDVGAANRALSAFGGNLTDYIKTANQRAQAPRPMTQAEQIQAQIRAQGQPTNDIGVMSEETATMPPESGPPSVADQIRAQGVNTDPYVGPRTAPMTMMEQIQANARNQGKRLDDIGIMAETETAMPAISMAEQFRAQGGRPDLGPVETTATATAELPGMDIIDQWATQTPAVTSPAATTPAPGTPESGFRFDPAVSWPAGAGPAGASPQGMPAGGARANVAKDAKKSDSAFLQPTERKVTQASPAKPAGQTDDSFSYSTGDRGGDTGQPATATPARATQGRERLTADQQFEKIMKLANGTPEDKAKLEEQISQDRAMGLLMAGLGTMGAASKPGATAFGSLAEGTMGGVNYYRGERRDRTAKELAAQKNRMEVGKLYSDLVGKDEDRLTRSEDQALRLQQQAADAQAMRDLRRDMTEMNNRQSGENARIAADARRDAVGANGEGKDTAEIKNHRYIKSVFPGMSDEDAWAQVRLAKENPAQAYMEAFKIVQKYNENPMNGKPMTLDEMEKKAAQIVKGASSGTPGRNSAPAPDPSDPLGLRKK